MYSKRFVPVLILTAFISICAGQNQSGVDETEEQNAIRLIFDYSDGAQKVLTRTPWKSKMTLGEAMDLAAAHKHGVKFTRRGRGSTAFVEKIDDLKNQGAKGPNWIFRVNGKLGDKSYAITPVKPGDTVLWKFDTYQ